MAEGQEGTSGGLNLGGFDLVTIGALLVLASWFIFDVLTDDYLVATVAVGFALILVLLPRIDEGAVTAFASVPAFLKLVGYALALIGAVEIVNDLESNLFDAGGATIFGALVAWVGYVAAFIGARQA